MRIKAYYIFIIILFCSCNSAINTVYDDTTARYNAYFIANEVISEIEDELFESAERVELGGRPSAKQGRAGAGQTGRVIERECECEQC